MAGALGLPSEDMFLEPTRSPNSKLNTPRYATRLGAENRHARIGAVDPVTGDLWIANSPIPNTDPEVRWIFSLHPGDIESTSEGVAVALAPAPR